jgi:hypothetical protein
MDLIILTDGMYHLVPVTKQMMEGISFVEKVTLSCFDMCDILRIKLTTYAEHPLNAHIMHDGSGDFFGCICR